MARGNILFDAGFAILPGFEGLKRRSAASYERALAEHVVTETRLRTALARDDALLAQMDALTRRREVLSQESDHRLLNNLQMIVSLLSLQSQTEANAETASRLSIAANRVATIARVHRHLHSMDGTQIVRFKRYLDDLCRDYSTMLTSEMRPDQVIAVEGIETELPTVTGIPLSLIANELITNAIKHGEGRITVKLERQSGKGHALSVCNDGSVLPEDFDPEACEGLGMSLVTGLAAQIGGKLRIDRGDTGKGTRFTVLFS
jgi:two-component sensor histidine kinase